MILVVRFLFLSFFRQLPKKKAKEILPHNQKKRVFARLRRMLTIKKTQKRTFV